MRYFKVQKGYGADDYISIDESELERAVRAQVTGKVAMFQEGTVAGNNIISITPDWHRTMGYNRGYQLTAEDYAEIGQERQDEYRLLIGDAHERVRSQLAGLPAPAQRAQISGLGGNLKEKMAMPTEGRKL